MGLIEERSEGSSNYPHGGVKKLYFHGEVEAIGIRELESVKVALGIRCVTEWMRTEEKGWSS